MRKHGLLLTHALVTSIKPQKTGLQHPSVRGYRLLIFGRAGSLLVTFSHVWSSVATKARSPSGVSLHTTTKLGHLWPLLDALGHFWTVLVTVGHPWASPRNRFYAGFWDFANVRYGDRLLQRALHQCPPSTTKILQAPTILRQPAQQISIEKGHKIHQGPPGFTQIPQAPPRLTSAYFPKNRLPIAFEQWRKLFSQTRWVNDETRFLSTRTRPRWISSW